MKKLPAVMIISFVAYGFVFWFDLPFDWSLHNNVKMSKSNQSVHGFWIHAVPNNTYLNDIALSQENILSLEISMKNMPLMHILQTTRLQELQNFVWR